jgi:predicted AlkP superfamily pyrophosphatase or phosphodiesterase
MNKILIRRPDRAVLTFYILLLFPILNFAQEIPLILISIDGFRYDYIEIYKPPHLLEIKKKGFSAKSLIPIYPSKTFPNHYSIITGLTAKNHGILSNSFKDKRRPKSIYKLSDRNSVKDGFWYLGEPFWATANKNGLKTASYFWVGSEAKINGYQPNYFFKYDHKTPDEKRVDQIIKWLKFPKKDRPSFLTLYFSKVDSAGHKFGPSSIKVKGAVHDVDDNIGRLIIGLKREKIEANILIVSDHGMREIGSESYTQIPSEIIKNKNIKIVGKGSLSLLYINKEKEINKTYKVLKSSNDWTAYKKNEIPPQFNFVHKHRAPEILIEAKPGKYLTLKPKKEPKKRGTHGYRPSDEKMHGIFLGLGPNIKNIKLGPVNNIDIFPFMAKLLNLKKLPKIDGKIGDLIQIYKENLNRTGK